ncbi:MAG: hypothetical protein V2B19_32580 [Pseudomonadota bacterium]
MNTITNLIPITAIVALVLFIIRELLDLFKKLLERNRELSVYKKLLSEEIKHNHFVLNLLNRVLKVAVKFNNDNVESIKCEVNTDRYGSEYVSIDLGEGPGNRRVSMGLKNFSTEVFDSHIVNLARFDGKLYKSIRKTYEEIRMWKTIRNDLVCYLANEIQDIRSLYLNFNLRMLKQEMKANFKSLEDTYLLLTGTEINLESSKTETNQIEKT